METSDKSLLQSGKTFLETSSFIIEAISIELGDGDDFLASGLVDNIFETFVSSKDGDSDLDFAFGLIF